MKKIVLFLIITFCLFINVYALDGDIDGDGSVKITDYILIRKHMLNSPKLTGDNLKRADVDGDGKVGVSDYVIVRKIILGIYKGNQSNSATISFNKSVINLETKDTYKIKYSVTPSNSTITWKSDNTAVATVSNDGVVTTKSLFGSTKITATTASGNKTEVTINVTKQRIHFINIGEAGNSILFDSYYGGKNHYVLIDAATCKGSNSCGPDHIDKYIGSKIQPVKSDGTLNTNGGVKKIDAVIVTHMHYDHAGYMATIIKKYKPDKVIIKNYTGTHSYIADIKAAAKEVGASIIYPDEGSEYTFGNFKLKIYNTKDVIGKLNFSDNVNSLVTIASITMGDSTYLTYLPGDLEIGKKRSDNTYILDAAALSQKIKSDYGLSKSRPIDIYVAAHHGYYNDDGKTGSGYSNGVNNHNSVIEPLFIKSSVVPNTFGWLCSKAAGSQYQGIKNIYDNIVKNGGDTKIRFSGATRVKAIFRSKGIELTGGEVLSCNSSTCGSQGAIQRALRKDAPSCSRTNYTK